ncbi:MAG: restriction endonuclease subunit S [Rhodocyclaceae bacterium]|nr:restriction endonuclease subunit S [Rhodocyclaceae bacterium]
MSEHLPLLASAPDGIKKLRGLILELAVRGKLVPQNSEDEPASELLKRIAKERATQKTKVTSIEEAESPVTDIATGWECAPLGEVVEIVRGITFPSSEKSKTPEAGRIKCLRTANVQDKIEWGDILYIRSEFVSRDDQMLRPNDIVMSMANSRELVGKVALVESQLGEPATFGGFLGVLRPHLILPRFVMAFLRAPTVRSSLIDSASQTTNIANISLAKLRPLSFPLPPLAEQHRIVAKVDELMALCDRLEQEVGAGETAHTKLVETLLGTLTQSTDADDLAANWQRLAEHFDTLFTTEASIDALKQTVLQLAVMGKLVPQDPNDELASKLLKRIAERRSAALARGYPNSSEATTQAKKQANQSCPENLKALPAGWSWATLMQCAELVVDCHNKTAPYSSAGIPLLRTTNIRNGEMNLREPKFVTPETYERWSARCRPQAGDLLITREAPMGEVCIIPEGITVCMGQRIMLIRVVEGTMNHRFLLYSLLAPSLMDRVQDKPVGATVEHLRVGGVETLLVQIPPLAEQHRIVAKVDELMALCDRLKADLAESRTRQARLSATLIESALQAA